jgi:hypothetical protein
MIELGALTQAQMLAVLTGVYRAYQLIHIDHDGALNRIRRTGAECSRELLFSKNMPNQ